MRVLVTGAGGFVGRRLVSRLLGQGHTPSALSRRPEALRREVEGLEHVWPWQPLEGLPPGEALEGVDAVIHLAGEPVAGLWTEAKKRTIHDSRVAGTRHLVEGLLAATNPPRVLVSASAIGYYGNRGEAALIEEDAPTRDFLSLVCQSWEATAEKAAGGGVRVVTPRIGIVLGREGGALAAMLPVFKWGLGGRLGSGRQWWSWIHLDDLVELILWAAQEDAVEGPVNATAPHPVRQGEFARALGRALHRPAILPAPALILRLLAGGFSWELLSSKRVLPEKALESGFRFRYGRLEPALAAIVGGNAGGRAEPRE